MTAKDLMNNNKIVMYAAADIGEHQGDVPLLLGIFDSLELAKENIRDYADSMVIDPGAQLAVYEIIINENIDDYLYHLNPVWVLE